MNKASKNNEKTLNVSEISRLYNLDRETVRKRLSIAGIEPQTETAREKFYLVTDELHEALLNEGDPELKAARLRKLTAEANLKELELTVKNGEFAAIAEFAELTHQWIGWLYAKLTIKLPKTAIPKIVKAKDKNTAVYVLQKEIEAVFNEFRANPRKFLDEKQ